MPLRRGFPARSRSLVRKTVWGFGPDAAQIALSATGSTLFTTGIVLNNLAQVTIVRIRGLCAIQLLTVDAVGAGFFGAIGIGIVSTPAFTAGIASVPTPITEANWEGWMFHQFFDVRSLTTTLGDGANAVKAVENMVIDTKAMRKFGQDETLMAVVEVFESTNASMELTSDMRVLVKLP